MNAKNFALVGGIIMLVLGALALIPAFTGLSFGLPILRVEVSYGLFLGLFAFNIINKALLIGLGLWGIAAASDPVLSHPRSITFARVVCWLSIALAALGLFPETNTLFGFMPLFGAGMWLHAVMALIGGIFGYGVVRRTA